MKAVKKGYCRCKNPAPSFELWEGIVLHGFCANCKKKLRKVRNLVPVS